MSGTYISGWEPDSHKTLREQMLPLCDDCSAFDRSGFPTLVEGVDDPMRKGVRVSAAVVGETCWQCGTEC